MSEQTIFKDWKLEGFDLVAEANSMQIHRLNAMRKIFESAPDQDAIDKAVAAFQDEVNALDLVKRLGDYIFHDMDDATDDSDKRVSRGKKGGAVTKAKADERKALYRKLAGDCTNKSEGARSVQRQLKKLGHDIEDHPFSTIRQALKNPS